MTFTDLVWASAFGQLVALGIVCAAWVLLKVVKMLWLIGHVVVTQVSVKVSK
jgi:hypothetical protein